MQNEILQFLPVIKTAPLQNEILQFRSALICIANIKNFQLECNLYPF